MISRLLRGLIGIGLVLLVTLVLFEVALRLVPSVIPTAMLGDFHGKVRAEIAESRGLRTRDAVEQTFVERAEGGPDFGTYPPNSEAGSQADEVDKAEGAHESVTTDERGFCNPPKTPLSETLVVGDSFVWCMALRLEDAWTRHLQAGLGGPVYNAGIPGIGLYEYNDILRWLLTEATPKRVVMSVYGGNDLRDAIRFRNWHEKNEAAEADTASQPADTEAQEERGICAGDPNASTAGRSGFGRLYYHLIESSWLGCYSYAVNTLGGAALQVRKSFKRSAAPVDNFRYTIAHRGRSVPFNIYSGDTNEIWNGRALAEGRVELSLWQPALDAFLGLAREKGFQPLVIYIPSAFRVYETVFEDPSVADAVHGMHEAQGRFLSEWGAANAVPVLDLTEDLRAAAPEHEPLLYFPANVHLTPTGSQVVGNLVAGWMQGLGVTD